MTSLPASPYKEQVPVNTLDTQEQLVEERIRLVKDVQKRSKNVLDLNRSEQFDEQQLLKEQEAVILATQSKGSQMMLQMNDSVPLFADRTSVSLIEEGSSREKLVDIQVIDAGES